MLRLILSGYTSKIQFTKNVNDLCNYQVEQKQNVSLIEV